MKPKTKPAVNVQHVALFAAACSAAAGMATACDKLARAILGTKRGPDAYKAGVQALAALEMASTDGNKHTVRRYTAEALAIVAQHGSKVAVPTVAADRTEKAQGARKSLGIKPRGKKKPGKAAKKKAAPIVANFETSFRAMLKLQAGRANLIAWAKAEGFDLVFSIATVASIVKEVKAPTIAAPAMPKPERPVSPAARKPGKPRADSLAGKRNGATH